LLSEGSGIESNRFTTLAALVFKMKGFAELTALSMFYVAGFVWVMPKLLTL
jgi:hypothetical protein